MSEVAEHTVVVYKRDAYRFQELRIHYDDYIYIQCLQSDLISIGIIGFFVKTIEEDPQEPMRIINNPMVMTGYPLSTVH
jgi:hypothetical protein